jgi:hypothetical protein
MIIFDWDDTIQKNLNPQSSFGMFFKTLFYPCNKKWVKQVFKKENLIIITTRSKLYTLAIRLKCFLITFNFKAFSDTKVSTINPYFFYNENCKRTFSDDKIKHLELVEDMKISLCKIHDYYKKGELFLCYNYIDLDKYPNNKRRNS